MDNSPWGHHLVLLTKPIGVAAWEIQLVEALPEELRGILPTVEELEAELR